MYIQSRSSASLFADPSRICRSQFCCPRRPIEREGEREGRDRIYIREILGANCKTAVPLRSAQKRTRLGVSVAGLTKVIARPCVTCASISVAHVCRVCRVRARARTRVRARHMCKRISHAREIVLLTCGIPFITASFYSTAVRGESLQKGLRVQRFCRGFNSSKLHSECPRIDGGARYTLYDSRPVFFFPLLSSY